MVVMVSEKIQTAKCKLQNADCKYNATTNANANCDCYSASNPPLNFSAPPSQKKTPPPDGVVVATCYSNHTDAWTIWVCKTSLSLSQCSIHTKSKLFCNKSITSISACYWTNTTYFKLCMLPDFLFSLSLSKYEAAVKRAKMRKREGTRETQRRGRERLKRHSTSNREANREERIAKISRCRTDLSTLQLKAMRCWPKLRLPASYREMVNKGPVAGLWSHPSSVFLLLSLTSTRSPPLPSLYPVFLALSLLSFSHSLC